MTNSTTTLRSLQTAVNELHANVESNLKSAKETAAEAGAKLIEAKSILKHGEFKPWVAENFCFGYRTAKRYMDVAQAKMTSVSLFDAATSINEVLEIGKEPRNLTQLERLALIEQSCSTQWDEAQKRAEEAGDIEAYHCKLSEANQALLPTGSHEDDYFMRWYLCGLSLKAKIEEIGTTEGSIEWAKANSPTGRTASTLELIGSLYYANFPNKFEKLREIFPEAKMDQLGEITLQGVKSEAAQKTQALATSQASELYIPIKKGN